MSKATRHLLFLWCRPLLLILLLLCFSSVCVAWDDGGMHSTGVVREVPRKGQRSEQAYTVATSERKLIRIVTSMEDLEDETKYCARENATLKDISGGNHICGEDDVINDLITELQQKIIPTAVKLHADRLLVDRESSPLIIPPFEEGSFCRHFIVPNEHHKTGVPDADFVLYVAAKPGEPFGAYCATSSSGRPIAGGLNFVPYPLVSSRPNVRQAAHHIGHALGFNYKLMEKLGMTTTITVRGVQRVVVKSEMTKTKTREHYGCDKLEGMELDYENKNKDVSSTWSWRNAKDELMSTSYAFGGAYYTALTMATFHDMQFYSANSQRDDTWIPDVIAYAKRILKGEDTPRPSHRWQITGSWNPTKDNPELTREEETALARFRTGVSHRYGWLLRKLQPHIQSGCRWCNPQQVDVPAPSQPQPKQKLFPMSKASEPADCTECGAQYSCRNTAALHMVKQHGFTKANALWKLKFPHAPPPPDIPPEPPPPQPPSPVKTLPCLPITTDGKHPFACNLCHRTFPQKSGLTRHLRYMHNVACPPAERKRPRADKPMPEGSAFPCDKCDMIARTKSALKAHIRALHPEKPNKDGTKTQLIPQPASLRCEFCQRDFGNIGGLSYHKKQKHPPGTPILPASIQVTFPRNKKRQRDTSTPEREDRGKVQCGVCHKFYAHLASLAIHCRNFHHGEGMPAKETNKTSRPKGENKRDLAALICPTCNRQCMSKSGLTLHRMSQHGYQPIRAHTSQRTECEETALHLLSCPALRPLRVQYAITDMPLQKLCFSKQLAQFLLAVERNYALPQTSRSGSPTPPSSPSVRPHYTSRTNDEPGYGNLERSSLKTRRRSLSPTSNKKHRSSVRPNNK